jgi:hypothetical protein
MTRKNFSKLAAQRINRSRNPVLIVPSRLRGVAARFEKSAVPF